MAPPETIPVADNRTFLQTFLRLEALAGLALIGAAAAGMVIANSPLDHLYAGWISTEVEVRVGEASLQKPLLLWVNDALMALFFLLIGLELKREVFEGELSSRSQVMLPLVCAVAGIAIPAGLFAAFNYDDPSAARGWAIPAATDIAFALGVLAMLGDRVPRGLKTFLLSLAVFDDLGAILIIAAFYTDDISWSAKVLAVVASAVLVLFNRLRITRLVPYFLVGGMLWLFVLKSGMHATLAGVILGLTIPLRAKDSKGRSPLKHLEHGLHPWVAFLIVPVFAFANAGVDLRAVTLDDFGDSVTLGILSGLLIGKSVGVYCVARLMVRMKWAELPVGATNATLFGVCILSGIGFTMSLFIGTLAYGNSDDLHEVTVRLGVLGGSLVSAVLGFVVLKVALRNAPPADS